VGDLRGRLIAFDLDGTLVDSRRDLAEAANQLVQELHGEPLPEDTVARMIGEGAAVLVDRVLHAAGLAGPPDALDRFLSIYDVRLLNHTVPYPGVPEALRAARAHGRVALLTNKPILATTRLLDAFGWRGEFDDVVGGDGPYPRKPDPEGFQALMRRADSIPEASLLVGDSAIDHRTAQAADAHCCLVEYGFGRVTFGPDYPPADVWSVETAADLPLVFDRFARSA
jgi:phosphoglycolate phosphatase